VLAVQSIVSRETSPVDAAVVSISRFNTGAGAPNVIPQSVELMGTIRAISAATFERLVTRVQQVITTTAASAGAAAAHWQWSTRPYPALINDPQLAALAARTGKRLAAAAAAVQAGALEAAAGGGVRAQYRELTEPTLAAEDFALYSTQGGIPGCFVFMGIGPVAANATQAAALHTPDFQLEEARLPLGAAMHASLALTFLEQGFAAAAAAAAAAHGGGHDEL